MIGKSSFTSASLFQSSMEILEKMIAFDTTSREPNMDFMDFVSNKLAESRVEPKIIPNDAGDKANLLATLGPSTPGGVVLSGHSDVVPVDGQAWNTNPFRLVEQDGRGYGRGTADMKSFLAISVACAPLFSQPGLLKRPVQLAFSHDEEVGCIGAPALIADLVRTGPRPGTVIVGEPSNMKIIATHKGTTSYLVAVRGHEAHSSQTHLGLSANMLAVHLMGRLAALAEDLRQECFLDRDFQPDHSTLTIGTMSGGTAINILSGHCEFAFDLRFLPGSDPDEILKPFLIEAERVDAGMRRKFPGTGVTIKRQILVPALAREPDGVTAQMVARLAGDNDMPRADSFGSEAGQFQEAGLSTVICGPGAIAQAHQPNEYIEIDQIARCCDFMIRLAEHLSYD